MMQLLARLQLTLVLTLVLAACSNSIGAPDDGGPATGGDGGGAGCDPAMQPKLCVGDEVHECTADGKVGTLVETCPLETCAGGRCLTPCGAAAEQRSYAGCEYWPVDLENGIDLGGDDGMGCAGYAALTGLSFTHETQKVCFNPNVPCNPYIDLSGEVSCVAGMCDYGDDCSAAPPGYNTCVAKPVCAFNAQHAPFSIVVANPDSNASANVTLENASGQNLTVSIAPRSVQALSPMAAGFPDQSLQWSSLEAKSYRVTSDRPIVAYQFNPSANVAPTNDASLLLPAHTFDKHYYVLDYPGHMRRPKFHDYPAFFTVVASAPGTTTITVNATTTIRRGLGVDAFGPGMKTFSLTQWQTLNLQAAGGGDLSGTTVSSTDNPFGLYVGVVAATIGACCDDHLEDQMFPSSTWGKVYAVARSLSRGGENDVLRIMAQEDGTTVTLDPAPSSGSCGILGAGKFCEVQIAGDTEVRADKPIAVAHFLQGGGGAAGDPSLAFAVPTEQYRTEYQLLVPNQYDTNFFAVATTGTVELDGVDVSSQLMPFGAGTRKAGRLTVTAGPHRLICAEGCGVEVGGYSSAVSYLFAGGLDLKQIVLK